MTLRASFDQTGRERFRPYTHVPPLATSDNSTIHYRANKDPIQGAEGSSWPEPPVRCSAAMCLLSDEDPTVGMLMVSTTFVPCWTGRSAGFSP
jgi:hypothetical protein